MDDFLESIAANCQGKMLIIGTKEIPKKQNTEVDTELSIKPLDLDICRKHLANNQIVVHHFDSRRKYAGC